MQPIFPPRSTAGFKTTQGAKSRGGAFETLLKLQSGSAISVSDYQSETKYKEDRTLWLRISSQSTCTFIFPTKQLRRQKDPALHKWRSTLAASGRRSRSMS